MGLFDKFLSMWMKKFTEEHRDELLTAMHKVNYGGDASDIETITQDYYALLKAVYKGDKPKVVELDPDDYYILKVDGAVYDLDELIHHNDQRNTGRKMEIEALMGGDIPIADVQQRLNIKIQWNWEQ